MDFRITCDANQESGVGELVGELSGPTYRHFLARDYGRLSSLGVVLMCRDPALNFKPRIKFSKKEQTLYMDVMLHLPEIIPLPHDEKRHVVVQRLEREIRETLNKYNFDNFDRLRFESDLHEWFTQVPKQSLEPTAGRRTEKLKDDL